MQNSLVELKMAIGEKFGKKRIQFAEPMYTVLQCQTLCLEWQSALAHRYIYSGS